MLKILLVAPDFSDIDNMPEIRDLSRMHKVAVYSGVVVPRDLYEYCRTNTVDVIHIASHSDNGYDDNGRPIIQLSEGTVLTPQDVVSLAHSCGAKLLFINTCTSAVFAAYATRRGVPSSIYTTVNIRDANAWKAPMRFYSTLEVMQRGNAVDYHAAYIESIPDDGSYGWNVSNTEYQVHMIAPVLHRIDELTKRIDDMSSAIWELVQKRMNERRYADMLAVGAAIAISTIVSIATDVVLFILLNKAP